MKLHPSNAVIEDRIATDAKNKIKAGLSTVIQKSGRVVLIKEEVEQKQRSSLYFLETLI